MVQNRNAFRSLLWLLEIGTAPPSDIEWDHVLFMAHRHRLTALLYHQLVQNSPSVPERILQLCQRAYYNDVAEAAVREHELRRLLAALLAAGIPVVLLKGAGLAHTVYARPEWRSMGDLDLLVLPEQLSDAVDILKEMGYVDTPQPEERFRLFDPEFSGIRSLRLVDGGATVEVELHSRLLSVELYYRTLNLDVHQLMDRAIPITVGNEKAMVLCPEDMLAHVCLHLSLHGFTHLRGYVDIANILKNWPIDWEEFVTVAKEIGIATACHISLKRANDILNTTVPQSALTRLSPGRLRRVSGDWLASAGVSADPTGHAWEHLSWMLVIDRKTELVRLLAWLFFPGPAWLQERYELSSPLLTWFWTIVHPFVVLTQGILSIIPLWKLRYSKSLEISDGWE